MSRGDAGFVATTAGTGDIAERVRAVHRTYPTGVTIVTTCVDGKPYGLAVNAFSSVSLDPPLVLVCVAGTSVTYPTLFAGDHFAVNILASSQRALAAVFARSGGDKFEQVSWRRGAHGSPVFDGVSAHLELEMEKRVQAYTHTVFFGRVLDAYISGAPPLVYLAGGFFDSATLAEDHGERSGT
jgi:flavin reductase (DIM6/NTAB) family NADH-FMN oxidoreductase RutF